MSVYLQSEMLSNILLYLSYDTHWPDRLIEVVIGPSLPLNCQLVSWSEGVT